MALGQLQNEADLQRWLQDQLGTIGLSQSDAGVQDKSIGKGKLATDALNAFLKLMVSADLRAALGVQSLSWTTGGATSAAATVTHGLKNDDGSNRTPQWVFALANGTGGPDLIVVQAFTLGATTFQMQGGFRTGTAASNLSVNAAWVAIG